MISLMWNWHMKGCTICALAIVELADPNTFSLGTFIFYIKVF